MKKIILTCLLSLGLTSVFAQFDKASFEQINRRDEVEEFIWSQQDTYESMMVSGVTDYPDDDAIIIKKMHFLTTRKSSKFHAWRMKREVVFLQKKQSIEEYSTLEVDNMDLNDKLSDAAIRIFKKNGEIIYIRREGFLEENGGLKVAIPGLEVGDILDYYSYYRWSHLMGGLKVFSPDEIYFADLYPVLDHYCEFNLKKGTYFKFSSMNDAPEINIIPESELEKDLRARVIIHDQNRPSYDTDGRWVYSLRQYPVVRFTIIAGTGTDEELAENLMDKKAKAASETSDQMVLKMLAVEMENSLKSIGISKKDQSIIASRVDLKTDLTDKQKVEEYYRHLMHLVRVEKKLEYPYLLSSVFLKYVAAYCREKGIESNWLFAVPRVYGGTADVLIRDDIEPVLEMTFADGSVVHMTAGEVYIPFGFHPYYIEGSEAYSVPNKAGADKNLKIVHVTLPFSKAAENELSIDLSLELDEEVLKGSARMNSKGLESQGTVREHAPDDGHWYRLVTLLPAHENVTLRNMGGETQHFDVNLREVPKVDIKTLKQDDDRDAYLRALFYAWMMKSAQNELGGRFGEDNLNEIDSMTILNDGLSYGEGFSYEADVELKNMVSSAGPNMIINIGKLIGGQVKIGQEELDRQSDIYMPNPRQYRNSIRIKIPDGYTVEGLEALSYSVDNETGSFISSAQVSEGYVVLDAIKVYKNGTEPVGKWAAMIEFLDAAHDLSQKNILFKKTS